VVCGYVSFLLQKETIKRSYSEEEKRRKKENAADF